MLDAFVQRFAEHLRQGSNFRIPGLRILQVSARAARMGRNPRNRRADPDQGPYAGRTGISVHPGTYRFI
jgi:hypothetical protein